MFRHVLCATAVVLALIGVSACGDDEGSLSQARDYSKKSGKAIADEARTAMKSLKTVHVDGDVLDPDGTRIVLDLDVSSKGSCMGTIGVGDGKIELRAIGGSAWYHADQAFWISIAKSDGKRIAKKVGDKWVKLGGELSSLRSFCSITSLTGQMLPISATMKAAGPAMADAVPAVRLDVNRGQSSSKAYVIAAEPHRLAKVTQGDAGQLRFSDFDKTFTVAPPAAGQIFDLANLEKK